MDESYYNIRRVDDPEDGDVFTHLEEECPAPKISVVGDQWSIVFCVIKEYIGVSPIDRYTIGGNISPFRIKSLTVESVDFTPSIVLKKPLPR
jgi:hypothetical protein